MFDAAPGRRQGRTGLGLTTRLAGREAHSTGSAATPWRRWLSICGSTACGCSASAPGDADRIVSMFHLRGVVNACDQDISQYMSARCGLDCADESSTHGWSGGAVSGAHPYIGAPLSVTGPVGQKTSWATVRVMVSLSGAAMTVAADALNGQSSTALAR